jgi:excisionase family DNA binding protein
MAAQFLTVSPDTVYSLFQSGELPGRKVGRKWVTTKAAVLRWIESSGTDDALTRAVKRGDRDALAEAINRGKARIRGGQS